MSLADGVYSADIWTHTRRAWRTVPQIGIRCHRIETIYSGGDMAKLGKGCERMTSDRQGRERMLPFWSPWKGLLLVFILLLVGGVPALASHVINGTSGNDTLIGTSGVDLIYGFGGNDYISAKGGHDKYFCSTCTNGGVYGGSGSDELYGGTGDDGIQGGSYSGHCDATDSLFGQDGHDVLVAHGCAIKDYLFGGSGMDVCHMDYIDYRNSCEWWEEY
jgi:hypothetical protein